MLRMRTVGGEKNGGDDSMIGGAVANDCLCSGGFVDLVIRFSFREPREPPASSAQSAALLPPPADATVARPT